MPHELKLLTGNFPTHGLYGHWGNLGLLFYSTHTIMHFYFPYTSIGLFTLTLTPSYCLLRDFTRKTCFWINMFSRSWNNIPV